MEGFEQIYKFVQILLLLICIYMGIDITAMKGNKAEQIKVQISNSKNIIYDGS